MVPFPPAPKPFLLYGFVAFFLTLFTLREAFGNEATIFGTVLYGSASITFWTIATIKLVKKDEAEPNLEGVDVDSLNRAVSRFMMRLWLVFAAIGAVLATFGFLDSDWIHGIACALLAIFSSYYAYANWQNSRESSIGNSSAS